MSDIPAYIGAITVVGTAGILTATCAALYAGVRASGAGRKAATKSTAVAAILLGVWAAVNTAVAREGGYHTQLGKQPPWLPIEAVTAIVALLLLTRIPTVSRALSVQHSVRLLSWPHAFRVAGVALILSAMLGHLPALFAIPAGLGDIAVGLTEPVVAQRINAGHGRRAATWFNIFGIVDLVTAMILGGLTAYRIVHVSPVNSAVSTMPLALIPTVAVPILVVLHILTLRRLVAGPNAAMTVAPSILRTRRFRLRPVGQR